jgi:hypothetical protein
MTQTETRLADALGDVARAGVRRCVGVQNPYAYSVGKPPESPALSGNQAQAIMHMPDLPCALEEWTDFLYAHPTIRPSS